MKRKGSLLATILAGAAGLLATGALAGCGNRPSKDIEGFYEGMRAIQLTYPASSSGTNILISLEAQINGRDILIIMNDCEVEARWEIGTDTFTTDDFLCNIEIQGDATDLFGSGTVTAPGDGTLSLSFAGMATDPSAGKTGTFTLDFSGTLVVD